MSHSGQKQTLGKVRLMSALPSNADMARSISNVRYVSEADSCTAAKHYVNIRN
jgi:hypothetical protein